MIERYLKSRLIQSLADFPVLLLMGPRQSGKSTLAEQVARGIQARYQTLDERIVLDAAHSDPDGWLEGQSTPLVIDEVQKAPDLMRAVKHRVDRDRRPGQYFLTGSANVLTLKAVSETLAGRVAVHELPPFSYSELGQRPAPALWRTLFESRSIQEMASYFETRVALKGMAPLPQALLAGSYPEPALHPSEDFRAKWYASYRATYVERDIRDVAAIENLSDFSRLLALAASRTGQIVNFSDLGRLAGVPYATLRRYAKVMEQTYQMFFLSPYFANATKRVTKAPKLYWTDTGMACALNGWRSWEGLQPQGLQGPLLETWAACELRKLATLESLPPRLWLWHLEDGTEVDFLLEREGDLVGVEVKSSHHADRHALTAFEKLRASYPNRVRACLLLYQGPTCQVLNAYTLAVPISAFFS